MGELLRATYEMGATADLPARLRQLAGETPVGDWAPLPGIGHEEVSAHAGQVLEVVSTGPRARVVIGYPAGHVPSQLSALLTVVLGALSLDGDRRLVSLELPASWSAGLPGPGHGVGGLRRRLQVFDRPLLMSPLPPDAGRRWDDWQAALRDQWEGGADVVQDGALYVSDGHVPVDDRVAAARDLIEHMEIVGGRRPLYAVNLTAPAARTLEQAGRLMERGAEAFLLAPYTMGLDVLADLARLDPAPVLLAHPALTGAVIGGAQRTIAPGLVFGMLPRAAGADIIIYPSPYASGGLSPAEAGAVARAASVPGPWRSAATAPAAGIHPGLIPRLVRDFGPDVVINGAGAIAGHPAGARAGALAFRQALERFQGRGGPVPDELAQALARWGGAA